MGCKWHSCQCLSVFPSHALGSNHNQCLSVMDQLHSSTTLTNCTSLALSMSTLSRNWRGNHGTCRPHTECSTIYTSQNTKGMMNETHGPHVKHLHFMCTIFSPRCQLSMLTNCKKNVQRLRKGMPQVDLWIACTCACQYFDCWSFYSYSPRTHGKQIGGLLVPVPVSLQVTCKFYPYLEVKC